MEFKGQGTADIFAGKNSKVAGQTCPSGLRNIARRKLDAVNAAEVLSDLRVPPGNCLEALHSDRKGQYSIRINDQYRVCFRWADDGPIDVEIVDYH